jgi:DivIVA domain-containing protein
MTSNKNDLDLPLLPSAEQIRRREFATVRRGYDPDQVREYLQGVAGQVETLERELREQRKTTPSPSPGDDLAPAGAPTAPALAPDAAPAAPSLDAYEEIAKRFAGVLETADKEASAAVAAAKTEATRIVEDARSEADRIQLDAQSKAEAAKQESSDTLANAKHEADKILGSLAERRESLVSQMHDMQTKLLSVAKDLETSLGDAPAEGGQHAVESAPVDDDAVDPRYEDMWALPKGKHMVDIPNLASLDVDFEDERRSD